MTNDLAELLCVQGKTKSNFKDTVVAKAIAGKYEHEIYVLLSRGMRPLAIISFSHRELMETNRFREKVLKNCVWDVSRSHNLFCNQIEKSNNQSF